MYFSGSYSFANACSDFSILTAGATFLAFLLALFFGGGGGEGTSSSPFSSTSKKPSSEGSRVVDRLGGGLVGGLVDARTGLLVARRFRSVARRIARALLIELLYSFQVKDVHGALADACRWDA